MFKFRQELPCKKLDYVILIGSIKKPELTIWELKKKTGQKQAVLRKLEFVQIIMMMNMPTVWLVL